MDILINISDEIYRHAKDGSEDSNDEWNAMRAIANGTPIDDDSLLAALMLFAMDNVTPQSKAQIKEKLLQILDREGE